MVTMDANVMQDKKVILRVTGSPVIRKFASFIAEEIHALEEQMFGFISSNIFLFLQFHKHHTTTKKPACQRKKICRLNLNFIAFEKKVRSLENQTFTENSNKKIPETFADTTVDKNMVYALFSFQTKMASTS